MEEYFNLQIITWPELYLRVGLAAFIGFVFGFDRSVKNKPIDFRVYMIVAISTCLIALMSQELYIHYNYAEDIMRFDLMRIIQGCLVGIGFLGAGAIIKNESGGEVRGFATGASIWGAGAIGLMLGYGMYGLALAGFLSIAVILVVFGMLRKPLFHESDKYTRKKEDT